MKVTKYVLRRKITRPEQIPAEGPLSIWWGTSSWLPRLELAHFMDMTTADKMAGEFRKHHETVEVVPVTISEGV